MRKLPINEIPRLSEEEFRKSEKLPVIILLDNIRSFHNTGSFFRNADAFRFEKIILCGITGKPPHRDIRKTALGASEIVSWEYEKDAIEAIKKLKTELYTIYSVEISSKSTDAELLKIPDNKKSVLVFGNEVKGVNQEIIDISDYCLEIPQSGTKHSLNVSISGGIIMWEFYKRLKHIL